MNGAYRAPASLLQTPAHAPVECPSRSSYNGRMGPHGFGCFCVPLLRCRWCGALLGSKRHGLGVCVPGNGLISTRGA